MNKFTLYLGLNDKDSKAQEISVLDAYKIAQNILVAYTEGGTIFEAEGFYTHGDKSKTLVIEKTLRIELFFIEREVMLDIVKALKIAFNQESIAVQHEVVQSEYL